jgi:hypothetical protein
LHFASEGGVAVSTASPARHLQPGDRMQGELQVVPGVRPQLRAFLVAQLRWERYRAIRTVLVHLLALSAALSWLPMPERLRTPIAAASGACFLGVLFAGMMEWHWGRERNRRAGTFSPGDPH